ncbi:SRPBCC family protein [Nocardia sp. NPDC004068]|uniref:SRPBCC family protein n=1 Tax=Nocardia sp. NPDC004068 TaxID=3364303 RepID=UPI003683CEFF
MRTLDLERTIQAPIADVFEWLSDATNYQRVHLIRRVTLVRPGDVAEHGVGAVRLIVTPLVRVTVRIVEYDPPRLFQYRILKSVPPLRYQDGLVAFAEAGSGTRVHWHSQFEVAAPLFAGQWTLALAPIMSVGLRGVLARADLELRR